MNICKNGYVYNNLLGEYVERVKKEVILPSFLNLELNTLKSYFKGETIVPVFRIFVLRNDETVNYEISEYVTDASFESSKQNGQVKSMSITLSNYDNHWKYGAKKNIKEGMKLRLDCGAVIDNILYWVTQGTFLVKEPNFSGDISSNKVSLSLCDKWGLWDGNVYGNTELKTIIPTQVPINQVFDTIVHENNGVDNNSMWDTKEILFDMGCSGYNTFYTIKQDAGQKKSELLLDMAKTIAADTFYDSKGHMRIRSNMLDFKNANYAPIWRFEEGDMDCSMPTLKYNKSKYFNKITTKGAIVNGYQFTATIENKNKHSLYNVYDNPVTPKTNKNTKLFSDQLCLEQCMYEMVQQSRGMMSVSLNCAYLPFLEIDRVVYLNFPSLGIYNEEFVIDSISYGLKTDCRMSLSLTSNNEVIF